MLNNSYNFALLLGATRIGREDIHCINAFNDIMEKQYAALRELIENLVGRKMQTPRDFDFLALYIWGTLHTHISPTTLKRFWGYLPSSTDATPRISTLDILASLAGYKRWSHYLEQTRNGACVDSGFTCDKFLYTRTLPEGTHLQLTWQPPGRCASALRGRTSLWSWHLWAASFRWAIRSSAPALCKESLCTSTACATREEPPPITFAARWAAFAMK